MASTKIKKTVPAETHAWDRNSGKQTAPSKKRASYKIGLGIKKWEAKKSEKMHPKKRLGQKNRKETTPSEKLWDLTNMDWDETMANKKIKKEKVS